MGQRQQSVDCAAAVFGVSTPAVPQGMCGSRFGRSLARASVHHFRSFISFRSFARAHRWWRPNSFTQPLCALIPLVFVCVICVPAVAAAQRCRSSVQGMCTRMRAYGRAGARAAPRAAALLFVRFGCVFSLTAFDVTPSLRTAPGIRVAHGPSTSVCPSACQGLLCVSDPLRQTAKLLCLRRRR